MPKHPASVQAGELGLRNACDLFRRRASRVTVVAALLCVCGVF